MFQRLAIPLLVLLATSLSAAPLPLDNIPDPLKSWLPWAMHGDEASQTRACPAAHDTPDNRLCEWISRIDLSLQANGGRWSQQVQVYAERRVALPGGGKYWPQTVLLDGKPVVVTEVDGVPGVQLGRGVHSLTGEFVWASMPESLPLPPQVGLVRLTLDGKRVDNPKLEADGALWLRSSDNEAAESRVTLRVQRKVSDAIPVEVATHIDVIASGKNRELLLPHALLPGFTALTLNSPLPARLEADGSLRVQLRPGNWEILLTGRSSGPVAQLSLPKANPLVEEEVWSFAADNALRLVAVDGVPGIDPQQAILPADWKTLPAYRVLPGDTMKFNETRRGDPSPAPDNLTLKRNLWLDFSGDGYTIQDQISGNINRSWRLEMAAPQTLGHAAVDGKDQLVTRTAANAPAGIEIRQGTVNIGAESRVESTGSLSATGWLQAFNSLSATLHLPPGWRLLHVSGADRTPSSWVERWSLFDFFVVLMTTLAVGKLLGWRWGGLALAALVLSWHEANAPHLAWINLLLVLGLLKVLPAGKVQRVLRGYRYFSIGVLVVLLVPFAVTQVRQTLYPALEHGGHAFAAVANFREAPNAPPPPARTQYYNSKADANVAEVAPAEISEQVANAMPAPMAKSKGSLNKQFAPNISAERNIEQNFDPNAKIQTGPALPSWRWAEHYVQWSGPVEANQTMRVWLISPAMNAVLTVLRLVALALLLAKLSGVVLARIRLPRFGSSSAAVVLLAGLFALTPTPDTYAAEIPSDELLQKLRDKLHAPADCGKDCAQISRLLVSANAAGVQLRLEAHADTDTAIPLPGGAAQWLADEIVVDGKPASALRRDEQGALWIALPRGVHQIVLNASAGRRDVVQIALPLKPHQIEAKLEGWTLEGLGADGEPGESIMLARINKGAKDASNEGELPPFVEVSRTLQLGLTWQVHTSIRRITPGFTPVLVEIPLLAGESVTSGEVKVEKGVAIVNLGRSDAFEFSASLRESPQITLIAPKADNQVQYWQLDLGPQWHAKFSGIPLIHQQNTYNRLWPQWRPWPGEQVQISLQKPEGVPGQTLTLDDSQLTVTPGLRASDASLTLRLRSSQGGQHSITLPEGASLLAVSIDNQSQAIRQEGRRVTLPIRPGSQQISVSWREPHGLGVLRHTPKVDLGLAGSNHRLSLTLPPERWTLLLGGPRLGPAILFWGVAIVLAAIAFALGRIQLTPLRHWQWLLLGLGLAPVSWGLSAIVMGWLLALGARQRAFAEPPRRAWLFKLTQLGLVLWTLIALAALFNAIQVGLLGYPDMQISGMGSSASQLNWFSDRHGNALPTAWVISLPLLAFRLLMLLWASWLAYSLLRWLKWGWEAFGSGVGYWPAKVRQDDELQAGVQEVGVDGDAELADEPIKVLKP